MRPNEWSPGYKYAKVVLRMCAGILMLALWPGYPVRAQEATERPEFRSSWIHLSIRAAAEPSSFPSSARGGRPQRVQTGGFRPRHSLRERRPRDFKRELSYGPPITSSGKRRRLRGSHRGFSPSVSHDGGTASRRRR